MKDPVPYGFHEPARAREFLEELRWPHGAVCPSCGSVGSSFRIHPRVNSSTREGLWKCRRCRRQFTVTVGTILEDSRMGLHVWLRGIAELCAASSEVHAVRLRGKIGLSYKSTLSLIRRVAAAVQEEPLRSHLQQKRGSGHEDRRDWGLLYPLEFTEAVADLLEVKPKPFHYFDKLGKAERHYRLRPSKRITARH